MPGEISASNAVLEQVAGGLRASLNWGHVLRLYVNDYEPTPASVLSDFAEATFPGYAEFDLTDQWEDVYKIVDGEYQFATPVIPFLSTGASVEVVYGWFIVGGSKVKLSGRFLDSTLMSSGVSLPARVLVQTWAMSAL